MNLNIFTRCFKIVTPAIIAITAGSLLLATGIASAASMTIYQKGKSPTVLNLSSVKNLTFSDGSPVSYQIKKTVTFAMNAVNTSGRIHFTLSGTPGSQAGLKLYSINGKILFSQSCRIGSDGIMHLVTPKIISGIYIARFINGNHIISQRVLTY